MIDLGADGAPAQDETVRQKLAAAIVAGGLQPVIGDGVEDALAGIATDRDSLALAAAMAEAKDKFGALACPEATAAANTAIAIGAARQAAGLAVPELPRALSYVLLCADRTGDTAAAVLAAARLRALAGAPSEVDPKLLDKYPAIDALSNRDVMAVKIETAAPGADVWIDFRPAGKTPLEVALATGSHIMAAATGSRRGTLTGTVVRAQPVVTIPLEDQAGRWSRLAARVKSWHGKLPSPTELAWVLREIDARVVLVRHGNTVEAWGHAGAGEPVRRLGNDDGVRPLDEAEPLVALVADRIQTWSDRAPDPDQPLLVETPEERRAHGILRKGEEEEPTRWWVYATLAGAIVAGAAIIYAHEQSSDTQRIDLRYP